MTRTIRSLLVLLLVAMFAATGCSSGGSSEKSADTQEKFGVRMARMNLWREAQFRFLRSVQINPEDALAHNNLAVAYEANGDFENAMKEYREAIRLDKSNQYIQKNYSRFVEFTSRNRKRQQRAPKPGETPAAATTEKTATPAAKPAAPADAAAPPTVAAPADSSGTSTPGSSTSPQPASTAPANVPTPPSSQPTTTPPETKKPPGGITS